MRWRIAFLAGSLLFLLLGLARAGPVQYGGTGHWYEAVLRSTGITWTAAKAEAEARGGYLVTIGSAGENNFVFGLVADPEFWFVDAASNSQGPYLGGYQDLSGWPGTPTPSAGWRWLDGGAWSWTNWEVANGEPNDAGSTLMS